MQPARAVRLCDVDVDSDIIGSDLGKNVAGERRYFTAMALVMIAISIAGFLPAIVDPSSRRAPLTPLAAVHGMAYFAWLVLLLVQTR